MMRNFHSKTPSINSKQVSASISTPRFSPKSNWEIWVSLFVRIFLTKLILEIFYIGLPIRKFPDFKKLVEYILGGDLLKAIGEKEANEKLLASQQ